MGDFICPFCASLRMNRAGSAHGKKRFRCAECLKVIYAHYPIDDRVKRDKSVKPFCFEDDVWDLRVLFTNSELDLRNGRKLDFSKFKLDWFKQLVKRYIQQEIQTGLALKTVKGRLRVLSRFSSYLEQHTKINRIEEVNRDLILGFIAEISINRQSGTIAEYLGNLRHFLEQGNLQGWFQIDEYLIRAEDYPPYNPGIPNDIPSCVLEQIENNLHQLPDPIARMWMVGFFCAMRLSELQLCPLDCLKQDSRGEWFITFWRKKNQDYHTLPISRDIAKIIQSQQQYIKQQFGDSFNYLFCDYVKVSTIKVNQPNLIPVARVSRNHVLSTCINCLIKAEKIEDANGKLWHFANHQLRHTRLTYLFETGHELAVVSKWAKHIKLKTTQKYVRVKDRTLREATAPIQTSLVNIWGRSIGLEELPETLRKNPNSHTLAMSEDHINTPIYGYCGLPLEKNCPHWKACYTCPSFIARRELLPDYVKIRDRLRHKQVTAEAQGETVKVDQFQQQADSLDSIIAGFEGVA